MRRFPKPFKFKPKNPKKYVGDVNNITMRSSWEKKFALWCDNNPSVLQWNSEGIPIQYWHSVDNKIRRYYIDFFVKLKTKDGSIAKLAIEVKPASQKNAPIPPKRKTAKSQQRYIDECLTYQQNQDKWKAAEQWCKQNGFRFLVMTEYELGIK